MRLIFVCFQVKREEVELDDLAQVKPNKNGETRVPVGENEEREGERPHGLCAPVDRFLSLIENWFKNVYTENSSIVKLACFAIFFGLYVAYVMVACIKDFTKAVDLFAVSIFGLFCFVYWFVKKYFGGWIAKNVFSPIVRRVKANWRICKW